MSRHTLHDVAMAKDAGFPPSLNMKDYIHGRTHTLPVVITEYFENTLEVFRTCIYLRQTQSLDEQWSQDLKAYFDLEHVRNDFRALRQTKRTKAHTSLRDVYHVNFTNVSKTINLSAYDDFECYNLRHMLWDQSGEAERVMMASSTRYKKLEPYLTGIVCLSNGLGWAYHDYNDLRNTNDWNDVFDPESEEERMSYDDIFDLLEGLIRQKAPSSERRQRKRKRDEVGDAVSLQRPSSSTSNITLNDLPTELLEMIVRNGNLRWADIASFAGLNYRFRDLIISRGERFAEEMVEKKYTAIYEKLDKTSITSWVSFILGLDYTYLRYTDGTKTKIEYIDRFYAWPMANEIIREMHGAQYYLCDFHNIPFH